MLIGAGEHEHWPELGGGDTRAETGTSGWFEHGELSLFGVLHRPVREQVNSTGVVFVSPFGWQDLYSYRSRRYWATRLARAGFTTLRYDLPGTGDSFGEVDDPLRFDAWVNSVGAAVRFLRSVPSITRVAVFGIELGGLIAMRSLAAGAEIDDLLLWGAPTKGRALMRRMSSYAAIATSQYAADHSDEDLGGGLDLAGFYLSPQFKTAIESFQLDAVSLPPRPGGRVLILGSGTDRADPAQGARFVEAGMTVEAEPTKDYPDLMTAPQDPLLQRPEATIARSIRWLKEAPSTHAAGVVSAADGRTTRADPSGGTDALASAGESTLCSSVVSGPITETLVPIAVDGQITEVLLTRPKVGEPSPFLVLLLSPGAIRRVGMHRMYVEMARRWATRGVASVRFDLPAIGDAAGPEDEGIDERPLITITALRSAATAQLANRIISQILDQFGFEQFVGAGHCGGAYLAYQAAGTLSGATGCIAVELPIFSHSEDLYHAQLYAQLSNALRSGFIRRLLRQRITRLELRWAWTAIRYRFRARRQATPEELHRHEAVTTLDRLSERGTRVSVISSRDNSVLRTISDPDFSDTTRWPILSVAPIPTDDPAYHALAMQRFVHEHFDATLEAVLSAQETATPLAGHGSGVSES